MTRDTNVWYKLRNLRLVNLSDQSEFKKIQPYDCCSPAPRLRQMSEKMIFGLSQSWESCVSTLKSPLQRDQTCPHPCPGFAWMLTKPGRPKTEFVHFSPPFVRGFPPLVVRGDPCVRPFCSWKDPTAQCAKPAAQGCWRKPTDQHQRTWNMNCSQISWDRVCGVVIKWSLQVYAVNLSDYWKPLPSIWWLSL